MGLSDLPVFPVLADRLIIAPDDFHVGRLTHCLVVDDAEARHVDPHIGGRAINRFAVDARQHGVEHRENFNVPVIVDGGLAIGLEVEMVNHIDVVQIGGCRLIRKVHRVLERQIPDGKGFKLRVSRLNPQLLVMVELAEAGRHFAAPRPRRRYNHQRAGGFDIVVSAVALVADNARDVGGVARDGIVPVNPHPERFEPQPEFDGGWLILPAGEHHAAHIQPEAAERIDQAQHIEVICNAEVAAHLVLFNVVGVDDDHNLCLLLELNQHADLAVRSKAGQHTGGVIIVEQLAAELQIELAAKLVNTLTDARRLRGNI